MALVIFYENPDCRNNALQKALLRSAGHTLVVGDLLTEPWSEETLRSFFGERKVSEWFNRAAPKVKSGEINPETLDAGQALARMLSDPLLIRRPLMECGGRRMVGFDPEEIGKRISLSADGDNGTSRAAPETSDRAEFSSGSGPNPCRETDRQD